MHAWNTTCLSINQCICDEPDPQPLRPDPVSTCLDLLAPSSDGHGRWWPAVLPWWPATIGYAAAAKAAGWAGPLHAFQCLQPWIRDLAGRMWQLYARCSQDLDCGRNPSAWRSSARASAADESVSDSPASQAEDHPVTTEEGGGEVRPKKPRHRRANPRYAGDEWAK